VLQVSWDVDAHADALELARGLRRRGVACACDLTAGGDGDVRVSPSGARWSHLGRDQHGTVDAALAALVALVP
jgi:hypothetical protein